MAKNKYEGAFPPCICYWERPVEKLPTLGNANRNNLYILPNNSMWVLDYDGTKFIQVNISGSGGELPIATADSIGGVKIGKNILVDDEGKISTESNTIFSSSGDSGLSFRDNIILSKANHLLNIHPPQEGNQRFTLVMKRDGKMKVYALQTVLTAGDGIKIDTTDPLNPVISATASAGSIEKLDWFDLKSELYVTQIGNLVEFDLWIRKGVYTRGEQLLKDEAGLTELLAKCFPYYTYKKIIIGLDSNLTQDVFEATLQFNKNGIFLQSSDDVEITQGYYGRLQFTKIIA